VQTSQQKLKAALEQDRYARIRAALAMEPTPGPWDEIQREGSRWTDICQGSNRRYATPIVYVPPLSVLDENGVWKENKGETAANAKHIAACDPDTIRDLLAERDALEAENERLREQLRLTTVDQAIAEAEANDARAEIESLMDRTTRLTPNDAGYVVTHANSDGEHVETAITLTERLDLALEERGHEMVLAERAKETHR